MDDQTVTKGVDEPSTEAGRTEADSVVRVLDHGSVRLVEYVGSDLSIVRNARVSYDAEWRSGEDAGKDAKLIKYLWTNGHTSPFEAVNFTFDIKCPIFVARQWHRHRTWCLARGTILHFSRPAHTQRPGEILKYPIEYIHANFKANRNFPTMRGENLRFRKEDGSEGLTRILDVWLSGRKKIYKIRAGDREIRASADHLFMTVDGWLPTSELANREVFVQDRVGGRDPSTDQTPEFTNLELFSEKWVEIIDGYEVSDLGRVRSYWGQGSKSKKKTPELKKITRWNDRAVVGIGGKAEHVSRLVAKAFIPNFDPVWSKVLHRDDNAMDNRLSNLVLDGPTEDNMVHSYANNGRVFNRFVPEKILAIESDGEEDTFDVEVSSDEHNFVANGFVTHNSFNEVSARYTALPEIYFVPPVEDITTQSTGNKQMRTNEQHPQADDIRSLIDKHCFVSFELYKFLNEAGCPRELARGVLPLNTYTHFFGTVDLHNLFKFLRLRLHEHAQKEIRVYAQAMLQLIEPIVPVAVEAFRRSIEVEK